MLKFTEAGKDNQDVSITYTGENGIKVTKKDNAIKFSFERINELAALMEAAQSMLTFEELTDTTQLDINF